MNITPRTAIRVAIGLTLVLPGCTRVFSGSTPLSIVATPPPPPPEPEPEPEPEPPKPERVTVTADKIVIKDKIMFETGKSDIKEESFSLLDEIVTVFQANMQIDEVSIEGHTDSVGSDKSNQKLSESRAAAVRQYLVDKGVGEARLLSKGWGEAKPIQDNETDEGKRANRRVEFLITKQRDVKNVYEVDPATGERKLIGEGSARKVGGKK